MELDEFRSIYDRLVNEFGKLHGEESENEAHFDALFDSVQEWAGETFSKIADYLIKYHAPDRWHRFPYTSDFFRVKAQMDSEMPFDSPQSSREGQEIQAVDSAIFSLPKQEKRALIEKAAKRAAIEVGKLFKVDPNIAITDSTRKLNFGVSKTHMMEQIRFPLSRALIQAATIQAARKIFQESRKDEVPF